MAYTLVDPTDEVALSRVLERLPVDGRPEDLELSMQVDRAETPPWEAKAMARTDDTHLVPCFHGTKVMANGADAVKSSVCKKEE